MSGSTIDKLVRMANQIAAEFGHQQPGNAIDATSDHISHYWDPRMKGDIVAFLDAGGEGLSEVAAKAVAKLRRPVEPESQTGATSFSGTSDEG